MKQNKISRILSSILVICMLLSMFAVITVSAESKIELKDESLLNIITSDDTKLILGLSERKTFADLKANFVNADDFIATLNEKYLNDYSVIGTGTLIICINDQAVVIVKGDTNGDGVITSTDYLQIKNVFLGNLSFDSYYALAADTTDDGTITTTDYLQIKNYFLGTYDLYPEAGGNDEPSSEVSSEEPSSEVPSEEPSEQEVKYIANKKSKKLHIPTCSGVTTMSEKNKEYLYDDIDTLLALGYSPCGTCNAGIVESSEEPSSEVPSEEPSSEVPSEEPSSEVPSEEPSSEVSSEEPSSEVSSEEPSSEVSSEEPSSEVPSEEPSSEVSSEEPSSEVTSEEPYTVVDSPVADTAYKFALTQAKRGEVLYFTGAMSGYYLATTTDASAAADVYLESVADGFMLYTLVDGVKTYINIVERDDAPGKITIKMDSASGVVYTFNSELNILTTNVCDADYYLGTYGTYNTMSASKTTYITGDKAADIGVSQFPAYLVTLNENNSDESSEESSEEPSEEPSDPYTVVEDPVADTAYKFALTQAKRGEVLYFTGAMSGYYLATTTDASAAADVYLESVADGFMLYTLVDGVKTYINIVERDDAPGKITIKMDSSSGVVYTFNSELNILTINVCDADYYLGTYGTYNTMSASKTTYITGDKAADIGVSQFPAYLVL